VPPVPAADGAGYSSGAGDSGRGGDFMHDADPQLPPPDARQECISLRVIGVQTGPGLPIRLVARINFVHNGGTLVHAFPERHFTSESGEFGQFTKRFGKH
jgi:hypothetical protein